MGRASEPRRSPAFTGRLARVRGVQHVHVAVSLQQQPRPGLAVSIARGFVTEGHTHCFVPSRNLQTRVETRPTLPAALLANHWETRRGPAASLLLVRNEPRAVFEVRQERAWSLNALTHLCCLMRRAPLRGGLCFHRRISRGFGGSSGARGSVHTG